MKDDISWRWACLQLAASREWIFDTDEAMRYAEACISFLLVANAGRGVEHNAANVHPTHPTVQ